jgi:hypothetical protein
MDSRPRGNVPADEVTATQGLTGTATPSTPGKDGAGAPGDAPPAEETYSLARVKAIAAKEGRVGQAQGRAGLLAELGVTNEQELTALLEAGRTVKPAKVQDDGARLAEKIKAQADAEKAQLQAQIVALQAATEAAMVRDAVKSVLVNANLVDGGADLILAAVGIGSQPEFKLVVKDGKVAVVDQDGDPSGKSVDQFLTEIVKSRPYLHAPTGTATTRTGGEPKAKSSGPSRKLSVQEQIDSAVAAGMASATGANGSGR